MASFFAPSLRRRNVQYDREDEMLYLFRSGKIILFLAATGLGACANSEGYLNAQADGSGGTQATSSGGRQGTGSGGAIATGSGGATTTGSAGKKTGGTGGIAGSAVAPTGAGGKKTGGTGGITGSGGTPSGGVGGNQVSRDANGWTVVMPSSDSRVIYVSSSLGNNSNNGTSSATPLKTLAAGTALLRPGYPDHLLLKCGDVWYETLGVYNSIGGRSAGEPMLISSYGTGARPSIRPKGLATGPLFGHQNAAVSPHMYVIGIDFYDSVKDQASPDYQAGAPGVTGISWIDGGDDLLIEDCYFHFLAGGVTVQYNAGPSPQNITIRRNVITDQYATGGSLSQGLFLGGLVGANLIEENLFDHNAWDVTADPANVFNHHIYVADSTGMTIKNNLFSRDSSLSVKFALYSGVNRTANSVVYNNFFFEGEVGVSIAYAGPDPGTAGGCFTSGDKTCFTNFTVSQNVMSQLNRNNPTGRAIGWGIDVKNTGNSTFDHNLFTDFSFTGNAYAITLEEDYADAVSTKNTVENNLAYRINGPGIIVAPQSGWSGMKVMNNTIQDPDLGSTMVAQQGSFASTTYSGDTYSPLSTNKLANVGNSVVSYSTWVTDSGETGSQSKTTAFPDPGRNLDTYLSTLSPAMTLAQFFTAIRGVSKANWHPEYTAPVINDYIRAGFALPAVTP
jgi:Right handed beta helix region